MLLFSFFSFIKKQPLCQGRSTPFFLPGFGDDGRTLAREGDKRQGFDVVRISVCRPVPVGLRSVHDKNEIDTGCCHPYTARAEKVFYINRDYGFSRPIPAISRFRPGSGESAFRFFQSFDQPVRPDCRLPGAHSGLSP
jgi:hypothetical protein